MLVDTFICNHRICEMQDYRCWHTGTVGCLAMTRSQELSMLKCLWPHNNVSIVLDDEGREIFPILAGKQSKFSGEPVHDDRVGLLNIVELIQQLREPNINSVHHLVAPSLRLHGDPYVTTSVTSNHLYIRCVRIPGTILVFPSESGKCGWSSNQQPASLMAPRILMIRALLDRSVKTRLLRDCWVSVKSKCIMGQGQGQGWEWGWGRGRHRLGMLSSEAGTETEVAEEAGRKRMPEARAAPYDCFPFREDAMGMASCGAIASSWVLTLFRTRFSR